MNRDFGASFSIKYCRELNIDAKECLGAALEDLGVRRLRLMSYWDDHEPSHGNYDFAELDWQINMAETCDVEVSLCLGLRQPRWPENHWPNWAKTLPKEEWNKALTDFITTVVTRYKDRTCIVSYQLENEALLKSFGLNGDFDRARLRREFKLVKQLDPTRPVIMSTSDAWGIPWRAPHADMYGFSIYRYLYDGKKQRYVKSSRSAWFYHLRALLIRWLRWRQVYIHELQAEPWGPKATIEMSVEEQFISMSPDHVREAVEYARATTLLPADLWGLEWWYWLKTTQHKPEIWEYLRTVYRGKI
jgi:hypothetical protein